MPGAGTHGAQDSDLARPLQHGGGHRAHEPDHPDGDDGQAEHLDDADHDPILRLGGSYLPVVDVYGYRVAGGCERRGDAAGDPVHHLGRGRTRLHPVQVGIGLAFEDQSRLQRQPDELAVVGHQVVVDADHLNGLHSVPGT